MKFKQYLNELFDSSYKLTRVSNSNNYKADEFKSDNGEMYFIQYIRKENLNIDREYIDISFEDESENTKINDKGDAVKVFSTVMKSIKDNKKYLMSVDFVRFAANSSENSRVKLYSKFAKMFKAQLKFKNHTEVVEHGEHVHYFYNEQI